MSDSDREEILEAYKSYEERGPRRFGSRGEAMMSRERNAILKTLAATGTGSQSILDMGCAGGDVLRMVSSAIHPSIAVGIDIRTSRLRQTSDAASRIFFVGADTTRLPIADATIDLIMAFTLWSSLPSNEMRRASAEEAIRVLTPAGKVIWYDMRYPNPFNRRVSPVSRSDLQQWFPGFRVEVQPVTLIPQIARVLGPLVDKMYEPLARIRPLRSHYIGIIERR